jgi:hypothetical protein
MKLLYVGLVHHACSPAATENQFKNPQRAHQIFSLKEKKQEDQALLELGHVEEFQPDFEIKIRHAPNICFPSEVC